MKKMMKVAVMNGIGKMGYVEHLNLPITKFWLNWNTLASADLTCIITKPAESVTM